MIPFLLKIKFEIVNNLGINNRYIWAGTSVHTAYMSVDRKCCLLVFTDHVRNLREDNVLSCV